MEERTPNMFCMIVTLEVSKLSGWLNALALCRESNGGHTRCGASCGASRGASCGRRAGNRGARSVCAGEGRLGVI